MVESCWVVGDCVGHPACCAMVWVGFQSVRVSSPRYRGHVLKSSQASSSAWPQMHLVYPVGTWIERRAYHRWYQVRRGSCSRGSWNWDFVGVLRGYRGLGLSSRGGYGLSLRGVVGVGCSLGGPAWWPAVGWASGSGIACLSPCTAFAWVSSVGAVWPRVSEVGAAGDCGVGCLAARVRALGCGWCSGVLHTCPRVDCRMCSCGTPV